MNYQKVKLNKGLHNVVDKATGFVVGQVKVVQKTPTQGIWSGEFKVPLADGTVENIVVQGELGNTAASVIRAFAASVADKAVALPQRVTSTNVAVEA
jgi:hypothetical protein